VVLDASAASTRSNISRHPLAPPPRIQAAALTIVSTYPGACRRRTHIPFPHRRVDPAYPLPLLGLLLYPPPCPTNIVTPSSGRASETRASSPFHAGPSSILSHLLIPPLQAQRATSSRDPPGAPTPDEDPSEMAPDVNNVPAQQHHEATEQSRRKRLCSSLPCDNIPTPPTETPSFSTLRPQRCRAPLKPHHPPPPQRTPSPLPSGDHPLLAWTAHPKKAAALSLASLSTARMAARLVPAHNRHGPPHIAKCR